ncbi:hypothetical protein [Desulfosporosinus sp.]|uniref:hypothetical protein n=1 Tax=Desulfosporosinus sp. TaxID=157907 RepID=UPI0025C32106|nr:hypothetical protein [Desulfosporosinus sp.]MBC2722773.1 hypothetical protein [Desulfosporosinus sp.]MBC2725671.1 hypothetical protein [Desulfosporosinus sp.]
MNPPYEYRNIYWKEDTFEESGRVLVRMEELRARASRLDLYNYEGSKLPAYQINTILKVALTEGWVETLEKLHQNRKSEWKAEMFENPEGVKEYRLYTTKQNEPVCSSVIAISNNQFNTFSILSEDAAPLLKRIIEDYPPVFLPRYRNYRAHQLPTLTYLESLKIKFPIPPEPINEQRERTQKITVGEEIFSSGTNQAGETSGIIETIEALKCLEVLQA